MQDNDEIAKLVGNGTRSRVNVSGLLDKVLTFAAGAVLLIVGLMFSLLMFALAATVAVLILGFLWWKTRVARRQMREQPSGGRIIDGQVIRDSRFD